MKVDEGEKAARVGKYCAPWKAPDTEIANTAKRKKKKEIDV